MVEFCGVCGQSLPKGDLTIKGGKLFTSPDYKCPSCGEAANSNAKPEVEGPEPTAEKDIVVKKGKASLE